MSERKTDEIKFRVTPTEKARWQQLAEENQESLSTLIRSTVNRACFLEKVEQAAAAKTQEISGDPSRDLLAPVREVLQSIATKPACICDGFEVSCEVAGKDCVNAAPQEESTPDEMFDISKEDADRLVAEGKASWTFEARNG